jgi:hypothetical protein
LKAPSAGAVPSARLAALKAGALPPLSTASRVSTSATLVVSSIEMATVEASSLRRFICSGGSGGSVRGQVAGALRTMLGEGAAAPALLQPS